MDTIRRQLTPELEVIIPLTRQNIERVADGTLETTDFVISTKLTPDEETLIENARFPYTEQNMITAKLQEFANFMDDLDEDVTKEIMDDCMEPLAFRYERIFKNNGDSARAQIEWDKESVSTIKYYMQERLYVALVDQAKTNPALKTELEDLTHQNTTIYNLNDMRYVTRPKDIIDLWLKYNTHGKDVEPLHAFLKI